MAICASCGKKIKNPHYLDGKIYGYNCYKQALSVKYKQWEDAKNAEYSAKCFAAMQIFEGKKSSQFHDNVCKQWHDCQKLTAKQLECIIKGFTHQEKIDFWCIWSELTEDDILKWSIPSWIISEINKNRISWAHYMYNESIHKCLFYSRLYKKGYYFCKDVDDSIVYLMPISALESDKKDEEIEILFIVYPEN